MAYNENWERWCKISIAKHFDAGRGDTQCFVEGFTRDTQELADYIEVRVDGPYTTETSKDKFRLYFEVNILVVVKKGQDAYRINRLTGRINGIFLDCIEVRRYGNGPEDDLTVLGCLKLLIPFGNERLQTSHFGQIRPDTEIVEATVEGHYELRID